MEKKADEIMILVEEYAHNLWRADRACSKEEGDKCESEMSRIYAEITRQISELELDRDAARKANEQYLATIRGQAESIKTLQGFWHQEQAEHERLGNQVADLQAKYEQEHEAYMNLFRQLSEYERMALEVQEGK